MPPAGTPVPTIARGSRWTAPALWAVVILVGTSWPSVSVGPDLAGFDKLVHFSMYAVLAALVLRSTPDARAARSCVATVLGVMLLGAVDEWHQSFIPGRSMSLLDWVADSAGALTGVLAVRFIPLLAPRRQGIAT